MSVTPGTPVKEALPRLALNPVQERVSPEAVGLSIAIASPPLPTWKPTPPAPTKRLLVVIASVVSDASNDEPPTVAETDCVESAKPTLPETKPKRLTVAVPVTWSAPVVKEIVCVTGPVGVGVVIVTGAEVKWPPVSVPTSFVQSSGCAATVVAPCVKEPLAWLRLIPRLVTVRETPGMPLNVPFAIWPVSASQLRVSFAEPVGVIAASESVPLETEKPTPPAPIVRLWPTGMTSPTVVSVAVSTSGPGGPRIGLPLPSTVSIVPSPSTSTLTVCCWNEKETVPSTKPNRSSCAVPVAARMAPFRSIGEPPTTSWSAAWPKCPFESRSSAVFQFERAPPTRTRRRCRSRCSPSASASSRSASGPGCR